jgi:hypothetical protein
MGKLLEITYCAWMHFDTDIFISAFTYGYKQCPKPHSGKHLHFYLAAGIIISIITQGTIMAQYDLPMAPVSGDIINLYMPVALLFLLTITDYESNSQVRGWYKFPGTGIINLMFALKYPDNHFLISIGIACAIF